MSKRCVYVSPNPVVDYTVILTDRDNIPTLLKRTTDFGALGSGTLADDAVALVDRYSAALHFTAKIR